MLKYATLLAMLIALVHAQPRPTYAGSGNHRIPAVLPQYLQTQQTPDSTVDDRNGDSAAVSTTQVNNAAGANGHFKLVDWTEDPSDLDIWYRDLDLMPEVIVV